MRTKSCAGVLLRSKIFSTYPLPKTPEPPSIVPRDPQLLTVSGWKLLVQRVAPGQLSWKTREMRGGFDGGVIGGGGGGSCGGSPGRGEGGGGRAGGGSGWGGALGGAARERAATERPCAGSHEASVTPFASVRPYSWIFTLQEPRSSPPIVTEQAFSPLGAQVRDACACTAGCASAHVATQGSAPTATCEKYDFTSDEPLRRVMQPGTQVSARKIADEPALVPSRDCQMGVPFSQRSVKTCHSHAPTGAASR